MPRRAAFIALACASTVSAQQDDVAGLDAVMQGIDTLAADVVQLIVESDGGILEQSNIRMYLKKPAGFYWETIDPFPELIVTNGVTLWNYQPDLEQVVIENWDSSRSELAAQLLNGQTENLTQEYTVELLSVADQELQEFELTPLAGDNIYSRISISFIAAELDRIHLHNKNGEQTVWRFQNIRRNQPLADSLFEFEPPAASRLSKIPTFNKRQYPITTDGNYRQTDYYRHTDNYQQTDNRKLPATATDNSHRQ